MMNDNKMTRELQDITHRADSSGWEPIRAGQAPISCPECGGVLAQGQEHCPVCNRATPAVGPGEAAKAGASLIVVNGGAAGQVFSLKYEVHVIGRGEEADLMVVDPEISRMHARFKRHENHYIIEDLRSANGTWVNGGRVDGRQLLLPGDSLRLGQTELIIRYSTALG